MNTRQTLQTVLAFTICFGPMLAIIFFALVKVWRMWRAHQRFLKSLRASSVDWDLYRRMAKRLERDRRGKKIL